MSRLALASHVASATTEYGEENTREGYLRGHKEQGDLGVEPQQVVPGQAESADGFL